VRAARPRQARIRHSDRHPACRHLLPVRHRARRAPVTICLSDDDGRSFPIRILIEDGPGTCLSNDSTDGRNLEMSYPWLLEAPDGTLHASYTYHRRAIKYVRLAPGWAVVKDEGKR